MIGRKAFVDFWQANSRLLNSADLTAYKFIYTAVDEDPETLSMCLKTLVGERGFEPPTPWSRTMKLKNPSALSGVAYEPKIRSFSPSVVPSCTELSGPL